ncbi:hypothetical protein [Hippea maritima]|uniref:Uncharacterized protein n=1 Tax=Hippea maritima (strain ATCC 700847 / DSM 10411 / MH2) TaxID=760142 RepID=F2LV30_HIPMA|nr:hypothetical protein [Hippea maritima]AEA33614.1 hypothetical protein Hipma_0644 [Hippea maritima DSM 10411]
MAKGADKGGGGNDTVLVAGMGDLQKPLNLLQAIEEIQHMSAMEKDMEEPLDKNFLSIKQRLDFFAIGFRNGLLNGFVTALLTPLALGVLDKIIPLFGDAQPTFFDKIYAFLLAMGFSLGFAIFLSSLHKCYVGTVSKGMINNLFGGLSAGILLKVSLVFLIYNWIFVKLTPERVYNTLVQVHKIFPKANLVPVYKWILEFKNVLPESIVFIALTSLLMVILPTITLAVTSIRNKVRKETEID